MADDAFDKSRSTPPIGQSMVNPKTEQVLTARQNKKKVMVFFFAETNGLPII
jgi:hypothetical protein